MFSRPRTLAAGSDTSRSGFARSIAPGEWRNAAPVAWGWLHAPPRCGIIVSLERRPGSVTLLNVVAETPGNEPVTRLRGAHSNTETRRKPKPCSAREVADAERSPFSDA